MYSSSSHAAWRSAICGKLVEQRFVIGKAVAEELLHILFCADGCPQHGETLLGGREFPVACPCLGPKALGVGWLVAATVPNTSFALVEADVGMCFQVVGQQIIYKTDSVWLHDRVYVIQKGVQGFSRLELCLHCL